MQNGNFNYIMSTLLELWRNTCTCNTTGSPGLEYEFLFYIVSVICSRNNDLYCKKGHKFTNVVMNVYESSNKLISLKLNVSLPPV